MKKRNKFSLSNTKLLSCNQGQIVPLCLTEVLPGDTIQQSTSAFIRVSPLVAPVMHPVHCKIHHWYIPHRLVWDDFESFITGGADGLDTTEFPTITAGDDGFSKSSLADYLGIPPGVAGLEVSALPFRAYNLVYNEWYRDQDLQSELAISTESGSDNTTSISLQNASWEKDYFTTARPWPQKGADVTIPVNSAADSASFDVVPNADNISPTLKTGGTGNSLKKGLTFGTGYGTFAGSYNQGASGNVLFAKGAQVNNSDTNTVSNLYWDNPNLKVELSGLSAGSISIDSLRQAFALQRFEEHRALYGSRYVEYLRYLGIKASDARLQRPEYLGGGRQTIQFSEVLQTAEGEDPVGTLRGHGIGAMRTNRFRRFIEEHGYILSVMIVRPKAIYAQGLPRTFNRRFKEDFFQLELQNIGDQELLNKEVYAAGADPDGTFGYQRRYDEYRRHESSVAGEFRDILDYWHMARIFDNAPALNSSFVTANPTNRIYASTNTDQLYVMAQNSIQARRLLQR